MQANQTGDALAGTERVSQFDSVEEQLLLRAFVSNMEYEEKDLQLVQLILGIGRNLKIPVIAEGVETETQLRLLKELGCALVQGFYFSRPLPAAEFETAFIQNG